MEKSHDFKLSLTILTPIYFSNLQVLTYYTLFSLKRDDMISHEFNTKKDQILFNSW